MRPLLAGPSARSDREQRLRAERMQQRTLVAAMIAVAVLAGLGSVRVFDDPLVAIAAAGVAVLMLVAFLETLGLLSRR